MPPDAPDGALQGRLDAAQARELAAFVAANRDRWVRRILDYLAIPSAFRLPEEVAERTRVCLAGGLRAASIPHHEAMARRLAEDLAALGLEVTRGSGTLPDDETGVPWVRARTPRPGPAALLFSSHYDVVGASAETWKSPPFQPVAHDGWIVGRGATDAKGPLSAMVSAYEALSGLGWAPRQGLEFLFTGDEEVGGRRGVRSAALRGALRAAACVVGEPSAAGGRRTVAVMTRGRAEICLCCRREPLSSGHSAMGSGDSPLERLIAALEHLRQSRHRLAESFELLAAQDSSWPGLRRDGPQVRILSVHQPAETASGNVVGRMAEARLEVRFHPPLTGERVEAWLAAALAELEDPAVEARFTLWNDPAALPEASALHLRVVELGAAVGLELTPAAFPAGSDMSPLVNLHGIPTCIASCADLGNGVHGDDERISERELMDSVVLYASLMLGFAQEPI